jgi:hypothetical protein
MLKVVCQARPRGGSLPLCAAVGLVICAGLLGLAPGARALTATFKGKTSQATPSHPVAVDLVVVKDAVQFSSHIFVHEQCLSVSGLSGVNRTVHFSGKLKHGKYTLHRTAPGRLHSGPFSSPAFLTDTISFAIQGRTATGSITESCVLHRGGATGFGAVTGYCSSGKVTFKAKT